MKRDIVWAIALIILVTIALRIDLPYRVGARTETSCQGKVRIPDHIDELALVHQGITVVIPPGKKEVMLPVGKYEFLHWKSIRTDSRNRRWELRGTRFPATFTMQVTAAGVASPTIGKPITTALMITSRRKGDYTLSQTMTGSAGENVDIYVDGIRGAAPSVRIVNGDKSYDETFAFAYG